MISTKKELQEKMRNQITNNNEQAIKAMLRIYEYQTNYEQKVKDTNCNNGVGFTKADAKALSSLVTYYKRNGKLTDKQLKLLNYRIGKYAGQLVEIALSTGKITKTANGYIY